jgi:hypothetical protein
VVSLWDLMQVAPKSDFELMMFDGFIYATIAIVARFWHHKVWACYMVVALMRFLIAMMLLNSVLG